MSRASARGSYDPRVTIEGGPLGTGPTCGKITPYKGRGPSPRTPYKERRAWRKGAGWVVGKQRDSCEVGIPTCEVRIRAHAPTPTPT